MRTSAKSSIVMQIIFISLLACHLAQAKPEPPAPAGPKPPAPAASFAGVTFRLVEEQARRQYEIAAGTTTEVDFQSTLFVRFDPPSPPPKEASLPSLEWQTVQKLLETLNELAREYAALNLASVDVNDPCEVHELQRKVAAHDTEANTAIFAAYEIASYLGIPKEKFVKLLLVGAERSPDGRPPVYENLAQFLKKVITQLQDETRELSEKAKGYELTVTALRQPRGGENQAIHVEPYDNLPAGQLEPASPLDAYGIRMTPEEMGNFQMGLKMNERAANTIREIMRNGKTIQSNTKEFARNLAATLRQTVKELAPEGIEPVVLRTKLTMLVDELKRFEDANDTPANVVASSRALRETLEAIRQDVDVVADIFKRVESLEIRLTSGQSGGLSEIILGEEGIARTFSTITGLANELKSRSAKWQEYLDVLVKNGPIVAQELGRQLVVSEIKDYVDAMKRDLPELGSLLQDGLSVMSRARDVVEAGQTLDDVAHEQIWHAINTEAPPTGMIDLSSYPLNRKEIITIKVQFRSKEPDGTEKIEHVSAYRLEVEKLDLHASATASLIFARAETGDAEATDWQPNVAGMLNWYYRIREPDTTGENLWNWLSPGAGVHVASLDQGDDTIEFGLGANVTLWNGLLNAGYGFNLSQQDDREYYFVGLNLLYLLDIGRDMINRSSAR